MPGIEKIQVIRGVHWVEVPAANLRILCGCPADSVKHLMKRGIIQPRRKDGVAYETGPNAILLSDVMVQSGSFSNLAEFPVLQMLYRQGMLLPGHPNNTGEKPLIIGSDSQVRAQMNYIHRGNYGLVSEEELVAAGVPRSRARELMRMKLRFAFGQIRHPSELLDKCVIGADPVEIRPGVTIRRLRLNVFEIAADSESVTVDLNMPHNAAYEAPYPLGFHDIDRQYFAVVHSGCGDGWDINRPAMASIIMFQGRIYLIDAGANILHSLTALGIGINEIEGVFHTHAHDDHFCGLATLMRSDHRIRYYAVPHVRDSVARKLAALVDRDVDDFALYFEPHDLVEGVWNDIEGLEVRPAFSPHPVETTIMYFRALAGDGYRSYAHLADIASLSVLKGMIVDDESPGISPTMYGRVLEDYITPADLKKIDIGGGLIHGNAEDFAEDSSGKLVLAHVARDLTGREKEVGSGAPFGMTDVLIPGHQDYVKMFAFYALQTYFPSVPRHQLKMLMNNDVVTFNPESILLRKGTVPSAIFLILTGAVEMLDTTSEVHNILSAGGLVGEIAGMVRAPVQETFRAMNFVRALRIPSTLYLEFVRRGGLYHDIERLQDRRDFLQKSWLFGESLSYPVQNIVANAMTPESLTSGTDILRGRTDRRELFLVREGEVEVLIGGNVLETLGFGDFFGEGSVLFNTPCVHRVRSVNAVQLFRITHDVILDIPIVRWKLFETYERRMKLMLNPELVGGSIFQWRDEYATGVPAMDAQHKELLLAADRVYHALIQGRSRADLEEFVNFLVAYAKAHFDDEEQLMREHDYPDLETHHRHHMRLMEEVEAHLAAFRSGELQLDAEFMEFVKDWLINHILLDDRQYGNAFGTPRTD
ncbi:hemerythrin [Desulfobaculum xiamenense]|uniref:Hemerythrin n=1 Tax=Desulfobaculum xiamenense TaxID=995050 RepID=A0A846QQN7_9BACT|nr:bacteriohemerythrin [Desulfobaculum xiamenense]NJB69300.1 hemerythrin [Desulfobaculum xiamenense]